nr:hypothetical protein [uncultured Cellulosilyticum sp.]
MPFIFHKDHTFTLIDNRPRHGVLCQICGPNTPSRPFQLYPAPCKDFSVTIDSSNKFHILTLPNDTHLNYLCYENNHCLKKTQVVNAPDNYTLLSPSIFILKDMLYITYISLENASYNLVYQNIDGSLFTTLFTTPYEPCMLKSFVQDDIVYIFYIQHTDESYLLKGFDIHQGKIKETNYVSSYTPILDYSVCIYNDEVHMTYITEVHGKYQLIYYNGTKCTATSLCTTSTAYSPIIFAYLDHLWINAYINKELCTFLSIDNGLRFSMPTPSSIQGNFVRCFFHTSSENSLQAVECYAILSPSVKISTVYMIDFDHIHPDTHIPIELELYLEGVKLTNAMLPSMEAEGLEDSPPAPQAQPNTSPNQTSRPPTAPKHPHQDPIDSAKNAFMQQELTGFDIAPRI